MVGPAEVVKKDKQIRVYTNVVTNWGIKHLCEAKVLLQEVSSDWVYKDVAEGITDDRGLYLSPGLAFGLYKVCVIAVPGVSYVSFSSQRSLVVRESTLCMYCVPEPTCTTDFYFHETEILLERAGDETVAPKPLYVGNRNSTEVHKVDCVWVAIMLEINRVPFKTLEEALDKGYDGCYYCLKEHHTR